MSLKIAYFDVGFSNESYALNAKRYGGGAVFARCAKQVNSPEMDFYLFAPEKSFNECDDEDNLSKCVKLPEEVCSAIQRGYPIDKVINGLESFDIILHGHTCFSLNRGNLKTPIVHWSGFDGKAGNPHNDYILLYLPSFRAEFGEKAKYVKIGKAVPKDFREYPKEDFVFQVSRHDSFMNSIETAENCLKYGIKGIFAGPIHGDYNLLDYIDNKTTFYLGEISEEEKYHLHSRARMFCLPHTWEVPFNQSVIEANGVGTPIWVTDKGPFFKEYIKSGVNGFFAEKDNFLECYEKSANINQKKCWLAAKEYATEEMLISFYKALTEIKQEWNQIKI